MKVEWQFTQKFTRFPNTFRKKHSVSRLRPMPFTLSRQSRKRSKRNCLKKNSTKKHLPNKSQKITKWAMTKESESSEKQLKRKLLTVLCGKMTRKQKILSIKWRMKRIEWLLTSFTDRWKTCRKPRRRLDPSLLGNAARASKKSFTSPVGYQMTELSVTWSPTK